MSILYIDTNVIVLIQNIKNVSPIDGYDLLVSSRKGHEPWLIYALSQFSFLTVKINKVITKRQKDEGVRTQLLLTGNNNVDPSRTQQINQTVFVLQNIKYHYHFFCQSLFYLICLIYKTIITEQTQHYYNIIYL